MPMSAAERYANLEYVYITYVLCCHRFDLFQCNRVRRRNERIQRAHEMRAKRAKAFVNCLYKFLSNLAQKRAHINIQNT